MAEKDAVFEIDYTTESFRNNARISVVQVDRRYVIISDAVKGIWYWDSTTDSPTQLKDLVPYLPDNANNTSGDACGHGASLTLSNCPYVKPGDFLTWFRGRLFIVDTDRSRIRYSGTRTDLALREGNKDSNNNYAPIKPWQLWNQNMDLSRYNPGYGGSVVIGDPKQRITGLAGTENGLLVFKTRSIYIWNWPESAAPHEVSNGASVRLFSDNLGALGQNSIVQMGDDLFFLSTNNSGIIAIYAWIGGSLEDISLPISEDLQTIRRDIHQPMLQLFGNYLFVAYATSDGERRIRHGYDILRKCWFDMTSPRVQTLQPTMTTGRMLIGCDTGHVLVYPSTIKKDVDLDRDTANVSIPFLIRSKRFDFEDPISEKKFRKAWASIESDGELDIYANLLYNDESANSHDPVYSLSDASGTLDPTYSWEFTKDNTVPIVQGINDIAIPVNKRAHNVVLEIGGNADKAINIHALKIGARLRSQK